MKLMTLQMEPLKQRLKITEYHRGNCVGSEVYDDCFVYGDLAFSLEGDYLLVADGNNGSWTLRTRFLVSQVPPMIRILTEMTKVKPI